jgi:hypothetical protein
MKQIIAILTCLTFVLSCSRTTESTPSEIGDSATETNTHPTQSALLEMFPEYVRRTAIPDTLLIDTAHAIYGDFNADQRDDFASIVTNRQNGFQGVLIIHNSDNPEWIVFGAGKEINGMRNLDWIDTFKALHKGEIVSPTLVDSLTGDIIGQDSTKEFTLIGNGIYMHVEEGEGGGILFWTGEKYEWYHLE